MAERSEAKIVVRAHLASLCSGIFSQVLVDNYLVTFPARLNFGSRELLSFYLNEQFVDHVEILAF